MSPGSGHVLRLGGLEVATPVVLAPMAGITNAAFRQLCREQGAGLYVCEMITSRGIVERDRKTLQMLQFDPGETVRSVQLYGVDPQTMAAATEILCAEYGVGHVDLNFGCPVPKVTRKGGDAALPYKRDRLRMILQATVRAAEPYGVPRSRCTGVRRSRPTRGRRIGPPSPRSRPPSRSRCWATGTSGRLPTRCGWWPR